MQANVPNDYAGFHPPPDSPACSGARAGASAQAGGSARPRGRGRDHSPPAGAGLDLERLRQLDREEVIELCREGGDFSSEKAVAMADLLREDFSADGRQRAIWLYEEALTAGGAVPLDVYDRLDELRNST